ncbi:MAG: CDGSH iron-sulfur domain-containing protein [Deltaproteobacteria bacterium]|nr:CDGSH iron-sulfur domain-containing protein [Deltaproteobacteria bacterium]
MTVKITVLPNAPLKVTGDFEITDAQGNKIETKKPGEAFLCRCGHSANKPFCDGAHAKHNFKAP